MEDKKNDSNIKDFKRTVVIGIDDSDYSEYAFDFFMAHVKRENDNIVLVHVPEYSNLAHSSVLFSDPNTVTTVLEEEHRRSRTLLARYTQKMQEQRIGGKMLEFTGKVGEVILRTAEAEKAEMIVVGSRGLGTIRRTFLGSVSDYCLHHSKVPVLVCRRNTHVT